MSSGRGLTPAGEDDQGMLHGGGRFDLGGSFVGLGSLGHVTIMGEVGLEAEHSRCLGYGEGAASLKEQGFLWAPGTEATQV